MRSTTDCISVVRDGDGPNQSHLGRYKLLIEMQQEAINALRPGAPLSAAYHAAMHRLQSKAGHLQQKHGAATLKEPRGEGVVNDTRAGGALLLLRRAG